MPITMNSFPLISFLPLALSLLGPVSADPSCPPQRPAGTTTSLIATEYGTVFDAPVSIGNQEFRLLVDTGSSDTWLVMTGTRLYAFHNTSLASSYRTGLPIDNHSLWFA